MEHYVSLFLLKEKEILNNVLKGLITLGAQSQENLLKKLPIFIVEIS
jgi:hypothetical protein